MGYEMNTQVREVTNELAQFPIIDQHDKLPMPADCIVADPQLVTKSFGTRNRCFWRIIQSTRPHSSGVAVESPSP
jgi:hypothetical protein